MAVLSTGAGILIGAASGSMGAAYAGLVLPSGLWLGRASVSRGVQDAWEVWPLSRLYAAMGMDMQEWRATRVEAASVELQWISDAVRYYADQVEGRIRDGQALGKLVLWRESITHKIMVLQLINLGTTPVRVRAALQSHRSTKDMPRYAGMGFGLLAERLESDAKSELDLYLDCIYHHGYHQLLIYPFRLGTRR
jgi:hypothetical protein